MFPACAGAFEITALVKVTAIEKAGRASFVDREERLTRFMDTSGNERKLMVIKSNLDCSCGGLSSASRKVMQAQSLSCITSTGINSKPIEAVQ